MIGEQGRDVGREQGRAYRDRRPRRRRADVVAPTRMRERAGRKAEDEERRPVFGQHGDRGAHARQGACEQRARGIRAQEQIGRAGPHRDQQRVGIELERLQVENRREGEQHQRERALFSRDEPGRDQPDEPQRDRDAGRCKQIIGPVGARKDREPRGGDPGGKRRMLGIAVGKLGRPGEHLAHVEVDALGRFGDERVAPPQQRVNRQQGGGAARAATRVGERIDHPREQRDGGPAQPQRHRRRGCAHALETARSPMTCAGRTGSRDSSVSATM